MTEIGVTYFLDAPLRLRFPCFEFTRLNLFVNLLDSVRVQLLMLFPQHLV